jgi:hypothetical protein
MNGAFIMQSNIAARRDKAHPTLEVSVFERKGQPGVWTVEAIDVVGDGSIYQAIFIGPQAKDRATEYARMKYGV